MRSGSLLVVLLMVTGLASLTGCSRSELSAFGDPAPWQLAFPCADNLYQGQDDALTLLDRTLGGYANNFASPCSAGVDELSGPDEVILWEAPAPGTYDARLVTGERASLYVLKSSCDADVPACETGTGEVAISFDVSEGEAVLFVIDAEAPGYEGTYDLIVTQR